MVTVPRSPRGLWPMANRSTPSSLQATGTPPIAIFKRCEGKSPSRSVAEAIQLQNVMRGAHERPFRLHVLEPTQEESPEAASLFNLSDDWFHHRLARRVDGRTGLRLELAVHPVNERRGLGQRPARTRARMLAMLLFARRDVGVDRGLRDRGQVWIRAVARVGEH